ncbi:MAG: ABC transporter permease [Acidobacteriaceae bacterium]
MRWMETTRMRMRGLLFHNRERLRLQAEIKFHLDALTAENIAAGMPPEEARRAAMRDFGNATITNEQTQETWGWTWLERLLQDVRFATRQIRRAPGFALIAILTLALGIGANNAVFTLTHALLLEGLPIPQPDRLVRLATHLPGPSGEYMDLGLSLPMIQALQQRSHTIRGAFAWCVYDFPLTEKNGIHGIHGAVVSGNAFQTLAVHPALGRLLTPADDQPGGGPDGWAAVISHREWMEYFHGEPSVLGRHMIVTDHSVTIVGVAPEGFEGVIVAEHPDIYLPLEFTAALYGEPSLHNGGRLWLTAFARLRSGIALSQASAELSSIFPSVLDALLPAQFRHSPIVEKTQLRVSSARTGWSDLRTRFTQPLVLLQILVGAVLVICCANLSGLFLARASARQQEFAIRAALGAARGRLMRQLFIESLMLALPGALLGIGLAWSAAPWILHSLGNHQAEISLSLRPDIAVLAVTALCALLCTILFGMAPAWTAGHVSVEAALRGTHSRMAPGSGGVRRFFVPLQVALSLALVVLAALLGSTVVRLRTDNSGYRTKNVLFYITDFNRVPQKGADLVALYRHITARLEELPGVIDASVTEIPPLLGWQDKGKFVAADQAAHAEPAVSDSSSIGAHYFSAVGTPLLAGRDLKNEDADMNSCILNQAAATLYFPHTMPLGRTLRQLPHVIGDAREKPIDCEVVGIAQNAKYDTLHEGYLPIVYLSLSSNTHHIDDLFIVIHARSIADGKAAYLKALHEFAPTAPETDPYLFTQQFNDSIAQEQLLSMLSGFFAMLGLLLSGIGIYGLVAWNVTQRTMEIGVRMALGATRLRVFALVMRQVAVLLAVGVLAGGAAAFFAARSIRSFLFEVQPGNPLVFVVSALALVLIGLLAAMLPARRAVSIDPMRALRTE